MFITDLKPRRGSTKRRKRKGRGSSSGRGKTAGRGTKGFGARAGYTINPGFEGGQMPLFLRVPKRGFRNAFATRYEVINLSDLERFAPETPITPEVLYQAGLVRGNGRLVKVLGEGDCAKPWHVVAHKFSKSAMIKLAKVGGQAEVITG